MGALALVISLVLFNVFVMSILYHRSLTHRALTLHRWLARPLTWYMQGMAFTPPLTWVATHRLHHAYTDTLRDPYSPRVHGFWTVLLGTAFLVSAWRWRHGRTEVTRLSRGLPDPAFYDFCERRWFCFTVTGAVIAGFVVALGRWGVPLYLAQIAGFYLVVGWANSAGHTFGERPYVTSATNYRRAPLPWLLNVCMWGEGLHNYHHRFPRLANFALAGEFDPGFLMVRALARLGLASIYERPAVRPGAASLRTAC